MASVTEWATGISTAATKIINDLAAVGVIGTPTGQRVAQLTTTTPEQRRAVIQTEQPDWSTILLIGAVGILLIVLLRGH